jgi:hypothetical protein
MFAEVRYNANELVWVASSSLDVHQTIFIRVDREQIKQIALRHSCSDRRYVISDNGLDVIWMEMLKHVG